MSTHETAPSAAGIVRGLHGGDPIAAALGVQLLDVSDTQVMLDMVVDERHVGGHGRCHGAMLFTLADIAMSYLGNRTPGQAFATRAAIDFIGPVTLGDRVEAVAVEPVRRGKAAVYDVTLRVDDQVVAVFRGNTLRIAG